MQLNWFTVIAQIINFLTLVWLLKRFLYKPVLNAIAAREKKVADQLKDAADKMDEARKERELYNQKIIAFNQSREQQLQKVTEEASATKERLIEEARKAANHLRQELDDEVRKEQDQFKNEIRKKTREEIFAIAGKALHDLANNSLDKQIVSVFSERLRHLDQKDLQEFLEGLNRDSNSIEVRSAFGLAQEDKEALEKLLREISAHAGPINFSVDPALIGGIELRADGYKISWNIDSYLADMEQDINKIIPEKKTQIPTHA
jgi:F-type H+-transporting ATPase subunit b